MTIQTTILGYACMGKHRAVKRALEAFWGGAFDTVMQQTTAVIQKLQEETDATTR